MQLLQPLVLGIASPLACLVLCWSFQLPFVGSLFGHINQDTLSVDETRGLRIAIIGAGAGGSSAAYWISKAKERQGVIVHLDVYEKSGYIGGRRYISFVQQINSTSHFLFAAEWCFGYCDPVHRSLSLRG